MSEFKDKNLTTKEEIIEVIRRLREIDENQMAVYMPDDEDAALSVDTMDSNAELTSGMNEFADEEIVDFETDPDEVVQGDAVDTVTPIVEPTGIPVTGFQAAPNTDIVDIQTPTTSAQDTFGGDDDIGMHLSIGDQGDDEMPATLGTSIPAMAAAQSMTSAPAMAAVQQASAPLADDVVADEDMPVDGVPHDMMFDDVDDELGEDMEDDLQFEERRERFDYGQEETERGNYPLTPKVANYTNEPDRVPNRYTQAKSGDNPLEGHMEETIIESLELHLKGIITGNFRSALSKVLNKKFDQLSEEETASLAGTFINLLGESNSGKFEILREAYHGEIERFELIEDITNTFNEYGLFMNELEQGKKSQITELKRSADEEHWIKTVKPKFKKEYGSDWESVLYATANKRFRGDESVEENTDDLDEGRKAKLGSGTRFKNIEKSAKKSGARDPEAVAAAAGIKKYGKKRMAKMAAAGRKK